MACSNNVVRAALTPKFRDVNLLVEMLTYNMGAPAVLPAETVDACRKRYTPPINDFEIQILQVRARVRSFDCEADRAAQPCWCRALLVAHTHTHTHGVQF